MEKYTMFMDRKNQYSENEYTTQSNLQIQCNPYQATSNIFHRTRTNNFKICMEIQKSLNPLHCALSSLPKVAEKSRTDGSTGDTSVNSDAVKSPQEKNTVAISLVHPHSRPSMI